jgi:hypothetical protein
VPRVEFACYRVGGEGDLMAAQLSRAAIRLLPGPAARAGRQLGCLHGMGNRPPRVVLEVFARRDRAMRYGLRLGRRRRLLVRTSNSSCKAGTRRARRRLIEGVPLVGNWSEKLPTSREQDILPVMVLTGVLSPPHLESWLSRCQSCPSHCQWCQKTSP